MIALNQVFLFPHELFFPLNGFFMDHLLVSHRSQSVELLLFGLEALSVLVENGIFLVGNFFRDFGVHLVNAGLYFLEQVFVVVWKGLLFGVGLVGGCAFEGFGTVGA
jgi:hypothetical protein